MELDKNELRKEEIHAIMAATKSRLAQVIRLLFLFFRFFSSIFRRKRALCVEKFDLRNNFHIILNKIFVHHHFMYQVL